MPLLIENDLERLVKSGSIEDLNILDKYVEESEALRTAQFVQENQISNYQTYITLNSEPVISLAKDKTPTEIYTDSLKWIWIKDADLHGQSEKWINTEYFILGTPNIPSSPVKGHIAGDSEVQAHALVSILRANGISAENVRVVLGKVKFNNTEAPHMWVEIFDINDGKWVELEPSSGSYFDSSTNKIVEQSGLEFNFFKFHKYPSTQIWSYYNDKYFWDNARSEGLAPASWITKDTDEKKPPKETVTYSLPQDSRELRDIKIRELQGLGGQIQFRLGTFFK